MHVAVELPEKQGLKQEFIILFAEWYSRCSGTSRKTRIETQSIKNLTLHVAQVAVELPEKQGLKPTNCSYEQINGSVAVELPEKQGLKLFYPPFYKLCGPCVAVELPEKQGLKQAIRRNNVLYIKTVAVELPEKQGLKLDSNITMPPTLSKLQWNFQKNKD